MLYEPRTNYTEYYVIIKCDMAEGTQKMKPGLDLFFVLAPKSHLSPFDLTTC
jgi:hypothetical protein